MRGSHSHLGFHLTKHCAASLSRSTGESFNKSARMRSQVTFLSKERGVRLSCMKKEKKKEKREKKEYRGNFVESSFLLTRLLPGRRFWVFSEFNP